MLNLSKVETAGELFNVANGVKSQAEADEWALISPANKSNPGEDERWQD